MMIQSKRYITSRLEWEVPAGRIELDESPQEAAKRECLEESGCVLKELTYLGCHNPCNGMSDLKIHISGAKVKSEVSDVDKNEVYLKRWISKQKVFEMLQNNEIQFYM